ncbi:MAG: FmdE family protein [Terriglobales bacterium]
MLSLDEYLAEAERAHGHLCAGQVLGVRLAMLGLHTLGIQDPRGNREDRKRLVTFVEIDRCATDAIAVVTGCRLGKRALKFRDWGKMAATFVDLASPLEENGEDTTANGNVATVATGKGATLVAPSGTAKQAALAAEGHRPPGAPLKPSLGLSGPTAGHCYKAIRIAAKESSKALARSMHPEIADKNQQQMLAYREMPDDDLFTQQWVKVELPPEEFPGYKADRIVCAKCGEGINFHREVLREGQVLCHACAGGKYYEPL